MWVWGCSLCSAVDPKEPGGLQVQYLCETTEITSHYVIFAGAQAD